MVQKLCRKDNSEKLNSVNNTEATAEILAQFMIFLRIYEHQNVKNTTPRDNCHKHHASDQFHLLLQDCQNTASLPVGLSTFILLALLQGHIF